MEGHKCPDAVVSATYICTYVLCTYMYLYGSFRTFNAFNCLKLCLHFFQLLFVLFLIHSSDSVFCFVSPLRPFATVLVIVVIVFVELKLLLAVSLVLKIHCAAHKCTNSNSTRSWSKGGKQTAEAKSNKLLKEKITKCKKIQESQESNRYSLVTAAPTRWQADARVYCSSRCYAANFFTNVCIYIHMYIDKSVCLHVYDVQTCSATATTTSMCHILVVTATFEFTVASRRVKLAKLSRRIAFQCQGEYQYVVTGLLIPVFRAVATHNRPFRFALW